MKTNLTLLPDDVQGKDKQKELDSQLTGLVHCCLALLQSAFVFIFLTNYTSLCKESRKLSQKWSNLLEGKMPHTSLHKQDLKFAVKNLRIIFDWKIKQFCFSTRVQKSNSTKSLGKQKCFMAKLMLVLITDLSVLLHQETTTGGTQ